MPIVTLCHENFTVIIYQYNMCISECREFFSRSKRQWYLESIDENTQECLLIIIILKYF